MNLLQKCFKKKSVESLQKEAKKEHEFVRTFGSLQLILLGIGAIIGGGIFVFTGTAASLHAGPAITLSFALSGFVCICAGLCYAEFASAIPISGSSYTYAYAAIGELPAWIIGCASILAYFFCASAVAAGWAGYLTNMLADFNIHLPVQFVHTTGHVSHVNGKTVESLINIPAIVVSLFAAAVLYRGAQASSFINAVMVFIKMSVLFSFILMGFIHIDFANWTPYIPENTGKFGEFGISGIIGGASMVFLAYNGFDSICTAAQETKNPQRDLPIGIIGAIVISALTYMLVGAVLTGVVPYPDLNVSHPIAVATDKMGITWFSLFAKFGALAAIVSVILIHQYALVRMIYTITKDGLLPKVFSKTHPKNHIPHVATILIGVLMALVSSTTSLSELLKLSNFFILFILVMVCISSIYLRYTQPNVKRVFKCPFMPWTPIFAILLALQIMFSFPATTYKYACFSVSLILLFYFFYGKKK